MIRLAIVMMSLALAACGNSSAQPDACVLQTCASLGASCGTPSDGCGGTLTCGTCASGVCGGGGIVGVCSAEMCSTDGWCWQNPLPQGNPLFGIFGPTPNDVWAVGPNGTVLRFDGAAWRRVDLGSTLLLQDVWSSGPNDAWLVGTQGTIFHWDGNRFTQINVAGVDGTLTSVWGTSATDVWAVGVGGVMLRFQGATWLKVTSPTSNHLFSIWGSGPNDLWTAGAAGALYRYNGSWQQMTLDPPPPTDLLAVWGTGPSDVWTTGRSGASYHYDGGSFRLVKSGVPQNLSGIWGPTASDLWVVGMGSILLHWDGAAFMPRFLGPNAPGNPTREALDDIWGWGADAWIAGTQGSLYRLTGGDLEVVDSPRPATLLGIWIGGPDDRFAVGSEGSVLRWDGSSWVRISPAGDTRAVNAVWGSSGADVWAAGEQGLMSHYTGGALVSVSSGTVQTLNGLSGTGANDAWAVGAGGAIVRFQSSSVGWGAVSSPTTTNLNGVWARTTDDGWAVGDTGAALRWNGTSWDAQANIGSGKLHAVWGSGASDVYAVGDAGAIYRFDGQSWAPENSTTTDDLYGVWGAGGVVWAVGGTQFDTGGSTVVERKNGTWTVVDPGSVLLLRAVNGLPTGEVWIAGAIGAILHKP